jgi:hypothetical protein
MMAEFVAIKKNADFQPLFVRRRHLPLSISKDCSGLALQEIKTALRRPIVSVIDRPIILNTKGYDDERSYARETNDGTTPPGEASWS